MTTTIATARQLLLAVLDDDRDNFLGVTYSSVDMSVLSKRKAPTLFPRQATRFRPLRRLGQTSSHILCHRRRGR